jgi:predicted transcriptional regulator
MNTQNRHSLNFYIIKHSKDNQLNKVLKALKQKPMTMKEVDVYTNVMRENICRYIRTLLIENRIAIIRKRKCSITGFSMVNEYTANPDLFPKSNQLKMF